MYKNSVHSNTVIAIVTDGVLGTRFTNDASIAANPEYGCCVEVPTLHSALQGSILLFGETANRETLDFNDGRWL